MAGRTEKANRTGIWIIAALGVIAVVALIWFVASSDPVEEAGPVEQEIDAGSDVDGVVGVGDDSVDIDDESVPEATVE